MPKIWLAQADKTMLQRAKSLLNKAAKESWPVVLTEQEVRLVLDAVASTVASAGDHSRHNLEEVSETDIQMLWLMGACRDETGAPQLGPDGRLACPWWGRSGQVAGVPIAAVGKQPNAAAANDRSTAAARMANRAVAKGRAAQEAIRNYRLDRNLKHQNQNRIESDKNSIFDKMQAAAKQHEDLEEDLKNQQNYYEELEKSHKASQTGLTPLQKAEQKAHPGEFKERQDKRQKQLESQKKYIEHTQALQTLARDQRIRSTQDYIRLVASEEAEKVRDAVAKDYQKTAKEFSDFAGKVQSFIPHMEKSAADKVGEAVQNNKDDKTAAENAGRIGAWGAYKKSAQEYWKTKDIMNPRVAEDIGLTADKSLHHVIAPIVHHHTTSRAPRGRSLERPAFLPRSSSTDSFASTVSH